MNRRVTLVTALSVAGTAAVAAMSFAIVYEPSDDPSAGVPLLDTTSAVIAADGSAVTDPPTGAAPLPVSVDPDVPIVAAPVIAPAAAPPAATPGQPGRAPAATTPGATTAAPTITPAITPAIAPAAGTQPPATAAPATTLSTPATTVAPAAPAPAATTVTSTTNPTPATTVAARPEGVPADWPADKPIPPMPPGCLQPQLEDDGAWNCQH